MTATTASKSPDKEIKVAILDDWFKDNFKEITKIREVGYTLYNNPNNIGIYFSLLLGLYSTHSSYIAESLKVKNNLDSLKVIIFSKDFNKKLKKSKADETILKVIERLIDVFTAMNKSFSDYGIAPKPTEKQGLGVKR